MEILWILLVPIIWLIAAKVWLHTTFNWVEFAISIGSISILVTAIIIGSKWSAMSDTEIWNGQITKKEMVDGHYTTSYDCNCTRDSEGRESCSTCYEDHYTRSYDGYSTVGNWTFASIDTEWKSRRNNFPPPTSYIEAQVGDPASREHSYDNYVQAVPESLFHDASKLTEEYAGLIPSYPRVYDHYKIGRILQVGVSHPEAGKMNTMFNEALKTLGATKQVNIVVILTDIKDPSYRNAIDNAWLGGEKNDVIVIVGLEGNKIVWSRTITWALNAGNELFNVKMRDGVQELGTLEAKTFVPFVVSTIASTYDRPQMADYEYLKDEIDPPRWAFITALVIAFGGSALLTFVFHIHEIGGSSTRYRFGRRNRYFRR